MEKVIWDETFSVGVEVIDEQHKKLIKMLNTMIEAENTSVNSEIISTVLTEMRQYASEHFALEEKYMLEYGYLDYDSHKAQHKEFIKKVAMLCIETTHQSRTVPTEILEYLKHWLINHILKTDMQYKTLFNQMGLNSVVHVENSESAVSFNDIADK